MDKFQLPIIFLQNFVKRGANEKKQMDQNNIDNSK